MTRDTAWDRYRRFVITEPTTGIRLDISRMGYDEESIRDRTPFLQDAVDAMDQIEQGATANQSEQRMVGHYWLRNSSLAPFIDIREKIDTAVNDVKSLAQDIQTAKIGPFDRFLHIGIGGSALGPQLLADTLGQHSQGLQPLFLDNTDPDGMDRIFDIIGDNWPRTLTVVVSKSGGTKETRNGMLEAINQYKSRKLDPANHLVAVTGDSGTLFEKASAEKWLRILPMWDWVGGRTSITSAAGLLPAALMNIDIDEFIAGARTMDDATRTDNIRQNPAALMALMWYLVGEGSGKRNMVVLPYKDRLALFGKYLQQLVMESLGKADDRDGNPVHQGLTVYGNKGSTDQHAYIQQLRDGPDDFFALFIEVTKDRETPTLAVNSELEVEPGITTGDYLHGFLVGTREALAERGKRSMTITIPELTPTTLGALIALFERSVGLYAELIHVNAYDQPGVEAGKRAAAEVIELQKQLQSAISQNPTAEKTIEEWAYEVAADDRIEWVEGILERLIKNKRCNGKIIRNDV